MGLKPDRPVCDSFTHIVPVLQEINANININLKNNNTLNHVHTNKYTKDALYEYNNSNDPINKASNIMTHNNNTPSSSKDHPKKACTHDSNNKTNLSIFHRNIRGLFNKTDELITLWSTEAPHILCLSEHHLLNHEINNTWIQYYNLAASSCRLLITDYFIHIQVKSNKQVKQPLDYRKSQICTYI
jgi:hypothetical protein